MIYAVIDKQYECNWKGIIELNFKHRRKYSVA